MKFLINFGLVFFLMCCCGFAQADLVTSWDIGEKPNDFSAFRIDSSTGNPEAINWYGEAGADVYVVSTCAMWCNPCQAFANDSLAIVQQMASEGIDVATYDFVFQNFGMLEPDAADAQDWIDHVWTSAPENVWIGGAIPLSANESVTTQIFNAFTNHTGNSTVGIPAIAILDRNLIVRDVRSGYFPGSLNDSIRAASVPEPNTLPLLLLVPVGLLRVSGRLRSSRI